MAIFPPGTFAEPGTPSAETGHGLNKDVVFTDYSPLSANSEIVRRLVSPLSAAQIPAALARSGKRLSGQPVDLAAEKFVLYVPERAPPEGFGLFVFVPPWNRALVPPIGFLFSTKRA